MAAKFLIPAILSTSVGVGLDIMSNALSQAYPDTPHWVWVWIFWIGVALVSAFPLWLAWRGVQLLRHIFEIIEFICPIRRKTEWPHNASIAHRLYHAYSFVQFNKLLDESRFDINLMFFNGSNNDFLIDRVAGTITIDNMPNADGIPSPRMEENHPPTKVTPLTEFFINLDQHVPKDLASQISTCLELGRPLSLNLTKLTILLRRVDSGDTFSAPLRQGITCTKKSNEIAIGHIVYIGASSRG